MADVDDQQADRSRNLPPWLSGAAEALLVLVIALSTVLIAENGHPRAELAGSVAVGGILGVSATIALITCRRVFVGSRTGPGDLARAQASLALGLLSTSATIGWLVVMVNPPAAVLAVAAIACRVFNEAAIRNRSGFRALSSGVSIAGLVLTYWFAVTGRVELPAVCLFAVSIVAWASIHARWSRSRRS